MSDHVVVRRDHLKTVLGLIRRCACGNPVTQKHTSRGVLGREPTFPCDNHFLGQEDAPIEDLPQAEAVRALIAALETVTVPSRATLCPYDGEAFSEVPGYEEGYGCPVCAGTKGHVHLWGSTNPCHADDVARAIAHIQLIRGSLRGLRASLRGLRSALDCALKVVEVLRVLVAGLPGVEGENEQETGV